MGLLPIVHFPYILFRNPTLSIDMVVATPCNSLTASSSLDASGGLFSPLQENIKKDPTRLVRCSLISYFIL